MEHFERGLALLSDQDISSVPPLQLGADIKLIRSVINRAEAQCVRRVELFDREDAYVSSGDTSTTSWLRNNCQLSGFSADKHVKLARQLPELQATQKALESGEIGIEHALELARATDDMGAGAEAELLAAARTKDPAEVRQTAKAQRRVLVARDQGCVIPGCNWEARFCEVHHLDGWALGGGTRVGRMVLVCKVTHHRLIHEGGWKLVENADGAFALVPPWEQPRAG